MGVILSDNILNGNFFYDENIMKENIRRNLKKSIEYRVIIY